MQFETINIQIHRQREHVHIRFEKDGQLQLEKDVKNKDFDALYAMLKMFIDRAVPKELKQ